jgi:Zn-dependent protease
MFGFDSVSELIMFTIVIIISFVFHEFSHGYVSYLQGDDTAKNEGRLTLNPISHIDLFGLIAIYLVHFGWAKPVPINSKNYKNRRLGILITSLAGPLANLIMAFLGAFVYIALNKDDYLIRYFFVNLVGINITLAIFNMIPLPPLDGSKIFASIFGGIVAEWIYKVQRFGMVAIFLLFSIPVISDNLSLLINDMTFNILNFASLVIRHQTLV